MTGGRPAGRQGLAAAAPTGAEAAAFEEVPPPGVRFVPNVARATNLPWIDSNGWRFQRGLRKANYAKLPAGSAPLAAAEAFTFDVDADPQSRSGGRGRARKDAAFLKPLREAQPPMPAMANIGVVDSPSPVMGEVLNLLTRRNLLYRVVAAPDPALDLTVQLGTPDFPLDAAANPNEFAARVREKLGDDKRLVRLYGTSTVIARLTGDKERRTTPSAELCQPATAAGRRAGPARPLLGRYKPTRLAAYGAAEGATLTDVRNPGDTTEFWVPDFRRRRSHRPGTSEVTRYAIPTLIASLIVLALVAGQGPDRPPCSRAPTRNADLELNPDPRSEDWVKAPGVTAHLDKYGRAVPGPPTEIRSRWTKEHLYLLYICPYDELNLKPDPDPVDGDAAPVELGRRRGVHRIRLRAHRPIQGVPGVAARRVGRPRHRSRQPEGPGGHEVELRVHGEGAHRR